MGPDDAKQRAATVTLMAKQPAQELASALTAHGVMAGSGHFYGRRLIEAMSHNATHGALRMSFVHYTTRTEVNQAIDAMESVL